MSIAKTQAEIVDEFSMFEDWQDRYGHIIDLGREMDPLDPAHKTEANKVRGCQAQVWLHADPQTAESGDAILHFEAESDALIVNGLIAILMRVYSDRTPADILGAPDTFLDDIGLRNNLSQTRTNGLASMMNTIRTIAATAQAAEETKTAPDEQPTEAASP